MPESATAEMPPERVADEIERLADSIAQNDASHAEACQAIKAHAAAMLEAVGEANERADHATGDAEAAREEVEAVEFELGQIEHSIAYEAKGRIMEGQTDRSVLVWVLNQISTDEVIL